MANVSSHEVKSKMMSSALILHLESEGRPVNDTRRRIPCLKSRSKIFVFAWLWNRTYSEKQKQVEKRICLMRKWMNKSALRCLSFPIGVWWWVICFYCYYSKAYCNSKFLAINLFSSFEKILQSNEPWILVFWRRFYLSFNLGFWTVMSMSIFPSHFFLYWIIGLRGTTWQEVSLSLWHNIVSLLLCI